MASLKKKVVFAGLIGNILDVYDLAIYTFMATFIANYFFSPANNYDNLLYTFLIFFIGYLARPFGSIFFGVLSDKIGRKKSLLISIVLMGVSTSAIGLLPTYQEIGNTATLLLLLLRLAQGFSVGGEYINSVTFLVEHAGRKQKGFMGSWASVGANSGFLMASLIGFYLSYLLENHLAPAWIWRLPFLLTLTGAGLGYWIRSSCSETLAFIKLNATEEKFTLKKHLRELKESISSMKNECALVLALTLLGTSSTYLIYIYSPLYFTIFHHIPTYVGLKINTISILFLVLLLPVFGYLSDKYGRKKILLFSAALFFLLAYPFFWSVAKGTVMQFTMLQLGLTIAAASFYSIASVVIVEIMPVKLRCTMSAMLYGIAASIFGGASPLLALELIRKTGIYEAPSIYLMICGIVCFVVILFGMKKSSVYHLAHNNTL
jgi:MFS transporter, MHS family, proline/betaine transporter